MFRQLLAITAKELKVFFKDPTGLSLNFVMPLAFIVVMSFALSGTFGANASGGERPVQVLVVNLDEGPHAAEVIERLRDEANVAIETALDGAALDAASAERAIAEQQRSVALIFPANFSQVVDQNLDTDPLVTTTVQVIADPGASRQFVEPVAASLQGLVAQKTAEVMPGKLVDQLVDTLLASAPEAQRDSIKAETRANIAGDGETVVVARAAPAGMQTQAQPNSFQQNVPGYTVFGVFWIVQQLALSVVRERRDGTLRRLLAAPLSKTTLLLGKLAPYVLINLAQIGLMLGLVGTLFGLDLGGSPLGLIAVSLALAAAATSLGVLAAAFGKSEAQVIGLTTLLLILLAAIGGCFVPTFIMPEWMRAASLLTPHGWALNAYVDLIVRGYGLMQVLPAIGVLFGFALTFLAVGVWRFRFD
jgi:ABC-2 type transport system permease protein